MIPTSWFDVEKVWKNRVLFYPCLAVFLFWFFGAAVCSLLVTSRPSVIWLGILSLPSIILVFLAAKRIHQALAEEKPLDPPKAKAIPGFDRNFCWVVYGLLILMVLGSTYLHHFQPQVLRVPSNTNISAWRNPDFSQTVIHDQMNAHQRARFVSQGVIMGGSLAFQLLSDLFPLFLGFLCFVHARKHFGLWMATCFLAGSFVFTGLEESMWILTGRFMPAHSLNPLGEPVFGTYWFTRGGLWFLETPVAACVGWFFLAYGSVLVAQKVFPQMGLWGRAAMGGLIAMGIDLWLDPVSTSPEIMSWVWAKGDILLLFGIPHSNFVGWFLLIFLFALFWEKLPLMEAKTGRARATARFFSIILATEAGIFIFFGTWMFALAGLFGLFGLGHTLHLPPGW